MADSKRCDREDVHPYHGWTEPSPTGTTWYHVCPGIDYPPLETSAGWGDPLGLILRRDDDA